MNICPNCKKELNSQTGKCSECEYDLNMGATSQEVVHLITVADDIKAGMIEAELNSLGIPVLKKYKQTSGYMGTFMGSSKLGVQIYVPSAVLDKAQELLDSKVEFQDNVENKEIDIDILDELKDDEATYDKKRRFRGWIALLIFILPVIVGVLFLIKVYLFG